jgi:GNAT superfamily N-acetyltransferase
MRSIPIVSNLLSTTDPNLHLRFAAEADTSLILELIKGLAEYEKLSHEVVADEVSLQATLFGERPAAEVIIAEYQAQPAGFALFFHNYSTFLGKPGIYLEDLFVKPTFRGRGIGKELLMCLARIAVERDCGRFEWSVLDWNEPAIRFYKSLGGQLMAEWQIFRVTGEALMRLAQTT